MSDTKQQQEEQTKTDTKQGEDPQRVFYGFISCWIAVTAIAITIAQTMLPSGFAGIALTMIGLLVAAFFCSMSLPGKAPYTDKAHTMQALLIVITITCACTVVANSFIRLMYLQTPTLGDTLLVNVTSAPAIDNHMEL